MTRDFPKPEPLQLDRDIYSVTRLSKAARALLENNFPQVWVEGEISNLSAPNSGHLYFTLKDSQSQLRCAFFRNRRDLLNFTPKEGEKIVIRGRLTVYETRGDFQLVVQHMETAGEGDLQRAFDDLKRRLDKEGLFDESQKRTIPTYPKRIGIITSPSGAVIRDIISTCKRRSAHLPLLLYPSSVQGNFAVDELCDAIRLAESRQECDVLIIARGGGSLEDLNAFNQERLARTIFECTIPTVSGIGHQTDFTIADFVSDYRAATPTAAAELVSPDSLALRQYVATARSKIHTALGRKLERLTQQVDWLSRRVVHPIRRNQEARINLISLSKRLSTITELRLKQGQAVLTTHLSNLYRYSPKQQLSTTKSQLRDASTRLKHVADGLIGIRLNKLSNITGRLNTVSPLATLDRGYAMATHKSHVISDANQIEIGSDIEVRLARGLLKCVVQEKKETPS